MDRTSFSNNCIFHCLLSCCHLIAFTSAGYDVTVVDNLVNANSESLRRVQTITKCDATRLRWVRIPNGDRNIWIVLENISGFLVTILFFFIWSCRIVIPTYHSLLLDFSSSVLFFLFCKNCHSVLLLSSIVNNMFENCIICCAVLSVCAI